MALKIKSAPQGTATITAQQKDKGNVIAEQTKEEKVDLPAGTSAEVAFQPSCEVGFDASYTHNLGDYKSAKVGISLKIPCAFTEIDEAFEHAKSWVNGKLEKAVEEMVG